MRGDKIVIPQADLGNEVGNLRQWVMELAHEGHIGTCEAFIKHLKKVWHTSYAQHRDPALDLNRHLRSFRSTLTPPLATSPQKFSLEERSAPFCQTSDRTQQREGRT